MLIEHTFMAHISFPGFETELLTELKKRGLQVVAQKERLILSAPTSHTLLWSQVTWKNPEWLSITSINDAVQQLKKKSSLWMSYDFHLHRRSLLIQEKLLRRTPPPLTYLKKPPQTMFGAWTLWNETTILCSSDTTSVLPMGLAQFHEDKSLPSRAYLKLWELFTLHESPPKASQRVIDLGSSPGGWTWVLADLECDVISVDKAPLDERLQKRKNITYLKKDAFALNPGDIGPVDVLFSDIICEPARLFELVQTWRASGLCKKFICTIKFKGTTDFDMIQKFSQIPGSRLIHLCANKHEITWICDNALSHSYS